MLEYFSEYNQSWYSIYSSTMISSINRSLSSDAQELDDEVANFLQGSEPVKVSSKKSESVIAITKEVPIHSDRYEPHVHQSTDTLSLSTEASKYSISPVCSPKSSAVQDTHIDKRALSSTSRVNSPNNSVSLHSQERETGAPSSLREADTLIAQSELNFQVSYDEEAGEFTSGECSGSSVPVRRSSLEIVVPQESGSDHDDPSTTPAIEHADYHQSSDENSIGMLDEVPDEVLIVVMGPHGSGKSFFISSVIGTQHTKDQMIEGTEGLQSHFIAYLRINYHLLETPGFDNELETEVVARKVLLWLESYYGSGKDPANTAFLYLHPIGEPRLYGSIRRSLDTFKSLISPETWPQVVLGTTGWTTVERQTPGLAEKREAELLSSAKFWKDMRSRGAGVMRIPEQDVFARDTLERLRERITSRRLQERDPITPVVQDDRSSILQRKTDYLEYERRLLEIVSQIRGGDHRLRIAAPSSAFQLICNECRGNCGVGDVYQCQVCYRDTAQESFMLCSDCYHNGKSCDEPEHRQYMLKKKVKDASCKSHAKTNLRGWDFIPCSCCESYCDVVFLHCCECLHDSFNMCLACMKEGARCESEKHSLHIVCWWKGKGGLDSETPQYSSGDYLRSRRDDLLDDAGGLRG
ncbi:hypothetical protein GGR55DRAFT_144733 [Xylaria sp. FL0064]|nr:hypothetical protein GGR55DRAFT_144733 [Xylaria sp. FL0064]